MLLFFFFFSSRRRHTSCALVTGVQTCALPIYRPVPAHRARTEWPCPACPNRSRASNAPSSLPSLHSLGSPRFDTRSNHPHRQSPAARSRPEGPARRWLLFRLVTLADRQPLFRLVPPDTLLVSGPPSSPSPPHPPFPL